MSNDRIIRELSAHRVNGLNEALRVFVLDQPGAGNACHEYIVLVPRPISEPAIYEDWGSIDSEHWSWTDKETLLPYHLHIVNQKIARLLQGENETYYYAQRISFQNGPIKEKGYNGNSHEALLAILLDRMESFQAGPYASHDNQMALDHLQGARLYLHKRTMDRLARGVEGTHQK